MTNLRELTGLIDYSDNHRSILDKLTSLGCDTSIIQNPDIHDACINSLMKIPLYNIPVNSKYYEKPYNFNAFILTSYLRNGFCSLDNKPNYRLSTKITSEDLATLDYLGLDYPDNVSDYYIKDIISARLGKKFDAEKYTQDWETIPC